MCALAHVIEAAGIPTVVVALIREHAEAMRPPRTLWVPFELGRPLGAPEDPAFQRRVIKAALGMLEGPPGPRIVDFPDDAPADAAVEDEEGWACPVSFPPPETGAPTTFAGRLAAEVAQLKPWHEVWKRKRGHSGVGAARADVEAIAAFVGEYADGGDPAPATPGADMADGMKLAVNDLMTYYQEAANAQPGAAGSFQAVSDWFWGQTEAGRALIEARRRGMASDDARLAAVTGRLILPHVAAGRAG